MPTASDQPLRILHAVRAPVGGIFRHILDLAQGQVDHGHHVGIVADSLTGGERADAALEEIAPRLKPALLNAARTCGAQKLCGDATACMNAWLALID